MKFQIGLSLLIFAIITSCVDKQNKKDNPKIVIEHKLSREVQAAADSLSKLTMLSSGMEDLRVRKLLKLSSIEDLVVLTDHKTPNVRYCAFRGLGFKNYKNMRQVFYKHIKDSGAVVTGYGCQVSNESVMRMMLMYLNPQNTEEKHRFNQAEYNKYEKMASALHVPYPIRKDYEKEAAKLKSYDLLYATMYAVGFSKFKEDFEKKRKLISKNKKIEFIRYDDLILATAYFEVNGYNLHYADIERKGDTVILKEKMLEKNIWDTERKSRIIDKIVFVISDNEDSKIKTVMAE